MKNLLLHIKDEEEFDESTIETRVVEIKQKNLINKHKCYAILAVGIIILGIGIFLTLFFILLKA